MSRYRDVSSEEKTESRYNRRRYRAASGGRKYRAASSDTNHKFALTGFPWWVFHDGSSVTSQLQVQTRPMTLRSWTTAVRFQTSNTLNNEYLGCWSGSQYKLSVMQPFWKFTLGILPFWDSNIRLLKIKNIKNLCLTLNVQRFKPYDCVCLFAPTNMIVTHFSKKLLLDLQLTFHLLWFHYTQDTITQWCII